MKMAGSKDHAARPMNSTSGKTFTTVATRFTPAASLMPEATRAYTSQATVEAPMKETNVLPLPKMTASGVSTKVPAASKATTR